MDISEHIVRFGGVPEEFTVEVNPEDVSNNLVSVLGDSGVNRISIGVQRLSDEKLKFLRRNHTAYESKRAVRIFAEMGFNVSADFIFGLPNDNPDVVLKELGELVDLGVSHLSVYGLSVEEKTLLYVLYKRGEVSLVSDDVYRDIYLSIRDFLVEKGFVHYEISNFARCGFESKHNINYWEGGTYEGIGLSACGFDGRVRYANTVRITDYFDLIEDGRLPESFSEELTGEKLFMERIFLSLRQVNKGIDFGELERFAEKVGVKKRVVDFVRGKIEVLVDMGFLVRCDDGRFCLSDDGLVLSDRVEAELVSW